MLRQKPRNKSGFFYRFWNFSHFMCHPPDPLTQLVLEKKNFWTLWLFDCCNLSICHCLWWKMLPLFFYLLLTVVFVNCITLFFFVFLSALALCSCCICVYIYYHCFLLTNFIVNEIHCQNKLCEKSFNCEGAINAVCAVTLHTQR